MGASPTGRIGMKRQMIDAMSLDGRRKTRAGALMNSSVDLIARARRGDDDAFRLIFDRYARPVSSFIYDIVGQREQAEELTQKTFVRAYRNLKGLRDEQRLSTWLFGIAKNVARESIRTTIKDRMKVAIDDHPLVELSDDRPTPDGTLLNNELNRIIHDAIGDLDEDKRLVFSLKVLHQKSYEDIAEITGFSIPKVKTDLHRARAEMRRRIRPYLDTSAAS
ncbi:MAG: RNA polymerase sigma factor [Blastocatellia bacterium AA13]|nr:MAG: RNA polymerase sigma factor [Blastocatellia bacterium AA13]